MNKKDDLLSGLVILLDLDIRSDMLKLLRNLIAVCGGYWVEKFTSSVTHVLVSDI